MNKLIPFMLRQPWEELQHIFKYKQDELCEEGSPASTRALQLLRENPILAEEYYEATDEISFKFMPLSIFITSGARKEVIETIYYLCPKAISTSHPELGLYPLQAACEIHADYNVLEFLAKKYPDAMKTRDYKGDLIIHSVLSQGKDFIPRRKTVELLLNTYPQCLTETTVDGACPLGVAFRTGQSKRILEKIIEKRHHQNINSFYIGDWKEYELGVKDVLRFIHELLPKLLLTSFRCEPPSYSEDGFVLLIETLAKDHLIKDLTLAFPLLTHAMSDAFLTFFRDNKTVQNLQLTRHPSMFSEGHGVDTLLQGLSLTNTIKSLTISGLFLISTFEFGFLIAKAPKTLVLEEIMMENHWRSANAARWTSSHVKNLTIRNCKMRGKCLDRLLGALVQLPYLRELTLDYSGPEDNHDAKHLNGRDITKPILSLLAKNRLKSLVVQGLYLEVRHLSCALGSNTSLRVLHMDALRTNLSLKVQCLVAALIEDNQTLEDVKFLCDYNCNVDTDDDADPSSSNDIHRHHQQQHQQHQQRQHFTYVEDPAITYYTERNQKNRIKRMESSDKQVNLQRLKSY